MTPLGIHDLWLFVLAGWVLNLTPGPDVFYMVTSTLRGGFRAGAIAAAGVSLGLLVHVAAATLGVSALIAASATAFALLKMVGAAYLVWIGIQMLRSQAPAAGAMSAEIQALPAKTILARGFWSNALNPKVALFFLAFLPQFIRPDAPQASLGFFALGILFIASSQIVHFGYIAAAAWARNLGPLHQALHRVEQAAGLLFIGVGVKLALDGR